MSGEFERLMLPDPVTEGVTMESDPSSLPEMHFYAKEFSYLGINMGETRIEGYPLKDGFHIESIKAQSPSLILSARGDWIRDDAGERSDFNIHITSESLGTVLEAMDISSAMQGGQTLIHFDAWWQGSAGRLRAGALEWRYGSQRGPGQYIDCRSRRRAYAGFT